MAVEVIGVANKPSGYTTDEQRLLSTFANQVAVAIENARLYEDQRRMIDELEQLHRDLSQAERDQVLQKERERIAAELHDRIEQAIFSLGLKVNAILERESVTDPTAADLGEVRQLAIHTSEAVREAIFALSLPRAAAGPPSPVPPTPPTPPLTAAGTPARLRARCASISPSKSPSIDSPSSPSNSLVISYGKP